MNQAFAELVNSNQTLTFVIVVALNLVLGVIVALKDGRFELGEMAGILNKLFPMIGAYLALNIGGAAMDSPVGDVVETASWGALLPFVKGMIKNLRELGLPVEKVIGNGAADVLGKRDAPRV